MVSPLVIRTRIDKDFNVSNTFYLNEETYARLNDVNIPKTKRIKYLDECYSEYCNMKWEDDCGCKRILH